MIVSEAPVGVPTLARSREPVGPGEQSRYETLSVLGRGGMSVVYRVRDHVLDREVAMKRLALSASDRYCRETAVLFKREFQVLAELSHPSVIQVYDYGLDGGDPYYTMELVEGGDLGECSPMPWQRACALLYETCSVLSLLHSRRLVHRDITPRNIRCPNGGGVKLIDFGAVIPMGHTDMLVGTAPFIAPEALTRSALDARSDLFSVGATLYTVITGRTPYRAKDLSDLAHAWMMTPDPLSAHTPGIPVALEQLVASLLSVEPELRPASAWVVMERLAAIAGLVEVNTQSVARAYLSVPSMVGRGELTSHVRQALDQSLAGRSSALLMAGPSGSGRSRALDVCVLEAKSRGFTVLRANVSAMSGERFSALEALAEQLWTACPAHAYLAASAVDASEILAPEPSLAAPTTLESVKGRSRGVSLRRSGLDPDVAEGAFCRWILNVSARTPLLISIDDFDRADARSAAALARLSSQMRAEELIIVATVREGSGSPEAPALQVLASSSTRLELEPLTLEHTRELVNSLFGDVPNVMLAAERIYEASSGNPRLALAAAEHLVHRGLAVYDQGGWQLPSALHEDELPQAELDVRADTASALSPLALVLAEAHVLGSHKDFCVAHYALLCPEADSEQLEAAVVELLSRGVLKSDGMSYWLAHESWARALRKILSASERELVHRALVALYVDQPELLAHHLLSAGQPEQALQQLSVLIAKFDASQALVHDFKLAAATFDAALSAAVRLGRTTHEINELRRGLVALSAGVGNAIYWQAAPEWLTRLKKDSGFDDWQELANINNPGERLMRALQRASERYAATPAVERVYSPEQGIKHLVYYVAISIAIGSRARHLPLLQGLPQLLEPFAPLSVAVSAVWQNARATLDSVSGRFERARTRWLEAHERLTNLSGDELSTSKVIQDAIAYGICVCEASLGLESAVSWAERLEHDPFHRVSAYYLKKIILLNTGDWDAADDMRKQAELAALDTKSRQMMWSSPWTELNAHVLSYDLIGVRRCLDRIQDLADQLPGWVCVRYLALGELHRLRGDWSTACSALEQCMALTDPTHSEALGVAGVWPFAVAAYVECLSALELTEEASALAKRSLEVCRQLELQSSAHSLTRALALAEAKLGRHDRAAELADELIDEQVATNMSGLHLGATYEARTRIALAAGDSAALAKYAALTAQAYRHGAGSPLGARYERLIAEARRTAGHALPELSASGANAVLSDDASRTAATLVKEELDSAETPEQRAAIAIQLVCRAEGATAGHLYVMRDTRLQWVGSSARKPPAGLQVFLQGYANRLFDDSDSATVASTDTDAAVQFTGFEQDDGSVLLPLAIVCAPEGRTVLAGILALEHHSPPKTSSMALAVAIGEHLLSVGDATPLAM